MRWARHQVIPVVPVSVSLTTSPTSSSPNGRAACLRKTDLGSEGEIRKKSSLFWMVESGKFCPELELRSPLRNVSAKPRSRTLHSLFSLATRRGGFHLYKDMRHSAQLARSAQGSQEEHWVGVRNTQLQCWGASTEARSFGSLVCDGGNCTHSS